MFCVVSFLTIRCCTEPTIDLIFDLGAVGICSTLSSSEQDKVLSAPSLTSRKQFYPVRMTVLLLRKLKEFTTHSELEAV
jgi:hypothetical protein